MGIPYVQRERDRDADIYIERERKREQERKRNAYRERVEYNVLTGSSIAERNGDI